MNTLFIHQIDGQQRAASADEILAEAPSLTARRVRRGTMLSSPRAARDYLTLRYGQLELEVFTILFLDTCRRLIVANASVTSLAERGIL